MTRAPAPRTASTTRRVTPRCRAGASSLLRLAQPDAARHGDWLGHARRLGGIVAASACQAARPARARASALSR